MHCILEIQARATFRHRNIMQALLLHLAVAVLAIVPKQPKSPKIFVLNFVARIRRPRCELDLVHMHEFEVLNRKMSGDAIAEDDSPFVCRFDRCNVSQIVLK